MNRRQELVWAGNELLRRGLTVYTAGNISVRTEDGRGLYIKPSGTPYPDITPESLVVIDWEGNVIEGGTPSIEHHLHRLVYLARPDIAAIVHTHSQYATTLASSVLRQGIPAVLGEVAHYIGGPIDLAAYGPAGSLELAQNAVKCLGDRKHGILLKNHGALAGGKDLRQALDFAELIERSAQSMIFAHLLGGYDTRPETYRAEF
ncbi:MAG: class II aldolase/adducin family protein [Anaerolineae bacterium]|nr:class II aldolase/adducin family protein [Anaerolineae bacterium]